MILRYIKYHNFRPFIGDQRINFTKTGQKVDSNVVVILGDNTFGKSTFVLSFIWCFYGISKFSKPEDILNKKIENGMAPGQRETAEVEIAFEHDGKEYIMKRSQRFTRGNHGVDRSNSVGVLSYIDEYGETNRVDKFQSEVNSAMNAILPKELSSFFFFEGEKNNEISKKDLANSVKTLLGLDAYEKIITHLYGNRTASSPSTSSVMGYYLSKQNAASTTKAQIEFKKMQELENKIERLNGTISEQKAALDEYDKKIANCNKFLREAEPSKVLQTSRESVKLQIENETRHLQDEIKRYYRLFSNNSMPLFLMARLKTAKERLDEMNIADKGIKGLEASAIHELLHRGECLCGTDLKAGTWAYKNVEKYIDFIPPKNVGTLVNEIKESIASTETNYEEFLDDFNTSYKKIQEIKNNIHILEREERDISEKLKQIEHVDVSKYEENIRVFSDRKRTIQSQLTSNEIELSRCKSDLEGASKLFNTYKSTSEISKKYDLYYHYAKAIYKNVCKVYDKQELELRERLQTNISGLFDRMYSGHRDITIDNKYNIVMTYKGDVVDDTGGLRVIQYFAYVGGLIKLAFEIMKEKPFGDNANMLGEQYPLVLDAAFSHADETHTRNISRELSNASSQLVFALMAKDWSYAEEGLEGRVSKMYELKKIDETEVKIVEVN